MIYNIWLNLSSKEIHKTSLNNTNNIFLIPPFDLPYKYMIENKDGKINIHFSYYVDNMNFNKELIELNLNSVTIKYRKNNQKINMISLPIEHINNLDSDLKSMIKILNQKNNKLLLRSEISNYSFLEQFVKYLKVKLNKIEKI